MKRQPEAAVEVPELETMLRRFATQLESMLASVQEQPNNDLTMLRLITVKSSFKRFERMIRDATKDMNGEIEHLRKELTAVESRRALDQKR